MSRNKTWRPTKLPSLQFLAGASALVPALVLGLPNAAQAGPWTPSPVTGSPFTTTTTRTGSTTATNFSLDWSPWIGDKRVKLMSQPTGAVNNDRFIFQFDPVMQSFDTIYDRTNPNAGSTGSYEYIIEIDQAQNGGGVCTTFMVCDKVFDAMATFRFDANGGPSTSRRMTKTLNQVVTVGGVDTKGASIDSQFANDSTGNASSVFTDNLARLWVTVDWNRGTVANRGMDNLKDSYFQVPGPLPILGAGVGFGMSRRLRSRIRAARA